MLTLRQRAQASRTPSLDHVIIHMIINDEDKRDIIANPSKQFTGIISFNPYNNSMGVGLALNNMLYKECKP